MANLEHVKLVKKGAKAIDEWREEHPSVKLDLSGADLRGANLHGANLDGANLHGADLGGADLGGADLGWANLIRTNLSQAVLTGADLVGADLGGANLSGAHLVGADLYRADLRYADLRGADVSEAEFMMTVLGAVDLSETKGLETARHEAPSTVGVDTLLKSKGKIPEVFLRGCGVPEEVIGAFKGLVDKGIEFYSCFISYTEADDDCSERLYNDLQGAGIRRWRWREDAKWGEVLRGEVNRAVWWYDKLIVILSEESLKAPAVIEEIERALQKEEALAKQGKAKPVLFPVRLDDAVFDWDHYLKANLTKRVIGDFTQWGDAKEYKEAFKRLVRDLRKDEKMA